MPNFYPYLISSLPMLHFGMKLPGSFDKFLLKCEEFIPQQDFRILKAIAGQDAQSKQRPVVKKWLEFDTLLRNELVKLRALHKKTDPSKYLRPDGYAAASFYHIALAAQRNPSPLEGEKLLDQERWDFLDALSFGHYFDLDFLIIYGYKLLILERWERINNADKARTLEEVLTKN